MQILVLRHHQQTSDTQFVKVVKTKSNAKSWIFCDVRTLSSLSEKKMHCAFILQTHHWCQSWFLTIRHVANALLLRLLVPPLPPSPLKTEKLTNLPRNFSWISNDTRVDFSEDAGWLNRHTLLFTILHLGNELFHFYFTNTLFSFIIYENSRCVEICENLWRKYFHQPGRGQREINHD